MKLPEFLRQLRTGGRIVFESPERSPVDPAAEADCIRMIEALDERRRWEMASAPPELNREQAFWAVRLLFSSAQFLVYRDLGAEQVRHELFSECPGEPGSAQAYSVDLLLCWLPEIHRRAARVSYQDPLTDCLEELGHQWPLSSIGMKLRKRDDPFDLEFIWDDSSLRVLYVDRVISRRDESRLADKRVLETVRDAVAHRKDLLEWADERP